MDHHMNKDIKELTDFLDTYHVNYIIRFSSAIDFLDTHDIKYKTEIEKGRVVAEEVDLSGLDIEKLPDSISYLECKELDLSNNKLTSESIELLEKLKNTGVNVIYKQTKQTNNGCEIITKCAVDPDHYKKGTFQTIDVIEEFLESRYESRLLTAKQKYSIGNAIKYISRAGLKGSTPDDAITDLKKAENYIHRAITGEWFDAS